MPEPTHVVCPHCTTVNRVASARLGDRPHCGQCKQILFTGEPVTLNAETFMKHTQDNDIPVVVDFWAPWCGPCRTMAPVFAAAASRLEPNVRLAKVNTDEEGALATRFNIRSIPTLAVFHRGREVARMAGAMPLETLLRWVQQALR